MELPVWHLSMIVLLIIALLVIVIIVVIPSFFGLNQTGRQIDTVNGCREWNNTGCSQGTFSSYKDRIGCKQYEECLTICKNLGSCW